MSQRGKNKCICQICNCGRHKCPHHPRKPSVTKPCGISEYANKFTAYDVKPVTSCKPPPKAVHSDGPLSSETTTRVDYVQHPINMTSSCKKASIYEPSTVAFDGTSTYTKEYTAKQADRQKPMKPPQSKPSTAKFEGEPTYKRDYREWEVEKRQPVSKAAEWTAPTEPFKGLPTYTTDYISYDAHPPASCKPHQEYKEPTDPFGGETDYQEAYRKPLVAERTRPIVHKDEGQRSSAPMEGTSTAMHDYNWKSAAPVASCKPAQNAIHSDSPFQSDTTNRIDFKEWPQDYKPQQPVTQKDEFQAPKGEMSKDTTYHLDYVQRDVGSRAKPIDRTQKRADLPPFKGKTDYEENYKAWQVGPRERAGPKDNTYHEPTVPFEGQSTTQQHYTAHPGCHPPPSCKPLNKPITHDGNFDDLTMYRVEYTSKHVEPCPAALLNSGKSKYAFVQEDPEGHRFYSSLADAGSNADSANRMPVVAAN
ncbi:unnamed protein product [Calicophoron daubneyi]|uniref:Stabilizer of axonemal microtubules 2 n=1 Tax=Calicophoron daubneyi TaxID=300641 RepID=A0AAV2SZN2_CALDB